jgi:hypothetical protein
MDPKDKQPELSSLNPKAPYQRPELKRVGKLRDVTAASKTGTDEM